MIETYFEEIERTILYFKSIIKSYSIEKKIYSEKQGFLKGTILFVNENKFRFMEVKNTERNSKNKYRYHYMGKDNRLIFRYDNASHHKELKSFPHHKHMEDSIIESKEPGLFEVLIEVLDSINREQNKER